MQVQKKWYAAKLETARVAAEVKLRNRNADVQGAAAKMLEEKMTSMAQEGGVEAQLLATIKEQKKELARLQLVEEGSELARKQLAAKETELDKAHASAEEVRVDVRYCQGVMERIAKQDCGVELEGGSNLREAVEEFVEKFGAQSRDAMDSLRALRAEHKQLQAGYAAVEKAGAAAAASVVALEAEREEAQAREAQLAGEVQQREAEAEEAKRKLREAEEEISRMHAQVDDLTRRCEAAETGRAEAEAKVVAVETAAEQAAKNHQKQLQLATETTNRLRSELERVRAETASAMERLGELEGRLAASEERARSAEAEALANEEARRAAEAARKRMEEERAKEREAHEAARRALEERLAAAAKQAAAAQGTRQSEEVQVALLAKEREEAEKARAEAARIEAELRAELAELRRQLEKLTSKAELEAMGEAERQSKERLQIRARVSTTIPAGCLVIISPLVEGREQGFQDLVGRTLLKIHQGGGIKAKVIQPHKARQSVLEGVGEQIADAALAPAGWALDNPAQAEGSPRQRRATEGGQARACQAGHGTNPAGTEATGGMPTLPTLPTRSPRADPWNVGAGAGAHVKKQHRTRLDAQAPEWGPELHDLEPRPPWLAIPPAAGPPTTTRSPRGSPRRAAGAPPTHQVGSGARHSTHQQSQW